MEEKNAAEMWIAEGMPDTYRKPALCWLSLLLLNFLSWEAVDTVFPGKSSQPLIFDGKKSWE